MAARQAWCRRSGCGGGGWRDAGRQAHKARQRTPQHVVLASQQPRSALGRWLPAPPPPSAQPRTAQPNTAAQQLCQWALGEHSQPTDTTHNTRRHAPMDYQAHCQQWITRPIAGEWITRPIAFAACTARAARPRRDVQGCGVSDQGRARRRRGGQCMLNSARQAAQAGGRGRQEAPPPIMVRPVAARASTLQREPRSVVEQHQVVCTAHTHTHAHTPTRARTRARTHDDRGP
jgi:hypothetical protein